MHGLLRTLWWSEDDILFVGTGTTLEVTSKDGDRHVKLTGYKEVIRSLSLPDDFLASDKLEKHGGGYLTVNMREETYISRYILQYSLFQKKRTFNSKFFGGPPGGGGKKFTWSIIM